MKINKYYITAKNEYGCTKYWDGSRFVHGSRPYLYNRHPLKTLVKIIENLDITELSIHTMEVVESDTRKIVRESNYEI